jgi:hypothetical protein
MYIVLYLKESPYGLKYLGKCVNRDSDLYMGSGRVWRDHLKEYSLKHSDIKTTILLETSDEQELKTVGKYYSEKWNIVEDPLFANLRPETGNGGWGHLKGVPKSEEWKKFMSERTRSEEERAKMSLAKKGKSFSEEHKQNLSKSLSGRKLDPQHVLNMSKGISLAKKGKPLSEEHKQALRKPKDPNKNKATCAVCGKITTKTVISRDHGENKCNRK